MVPPASTSRRFHKPRHRVAMAMLAIAALAMIAVWSLWRISNARCFVLTGSVLCRVETTRPLVALTFDDGPTEIGATEILAILDRYDAKATFFLIGQQIKERPDLARALAAAGHEIANHSYRHQRMVLKSSGFYEREIERTDALIRSAGGSPALFRPPYGKKLIGLPLAVERHGLRLVTWDIEDPATADPDTFADTIVDQAKPGSIILIHAMYPSNDTARRALPSILEGLKVKGLKPVTVSTLIEATQR
jgi:peptidoglycan-N-acetylglucosamine deacetylase